MNNHAYSPGLGGVPATESAISNIDGARGILAYRGYSIETLAQHSSFEETTLLLLNGELPTKDELTSFKEDISLRSRVKTNIRMMMRALPARGKPMDILQTAIASMAMFYPDVESNLPDSQYARHAAIKIISNMSTLVAMWEHIRRGYDPVAPRRNLDYAANFLYMFAGEELDEAIVRIFDACLILHAEHTINASTFATMVTASTLTNPFAAISAAVGTLAGPLHGGANERVLHMLDEIGSPDNARPWIEKRLTNKQVIWGMGHREYKTKDPRANILQKMIVDFTAGRTLSKRFETALAVEAVCEEHLGPKGVYPNVDFYSGILYAEIGFPVDQFTPIFAMARSAGWIAHWREQMQQNRIFRPTQIYTGKNFRPYPATDRQ